MVMALKDAQARLREVINEIDSIRNGEASDEARAKFATLVNEGNTLKAHIEHERSAEALKGWAKQSGVQLPLAEGGRVLAEGRKGGGVLEGFEPAGHVELQQHGFGRKADIEAIKVLYDEGPGGDPDPVKAALVRSDEYRGAFRDYLRMKSGSAGLKVLQEGIDTQGGFVVPEDIQARVISRTPTPTRVAGRVMQMPTSRDTLVFPKINYSTDDVYTTGMRVTWTGEVPASSTAHRVTEPVFGQLRIAVYTAMMSIAITRDMIEDANFPLVSYVSGKFAETIDILRDDMALNGNGVNKPSGILLNPGGTDQPAIVVSGAAAALTGDGLRSLVFSLPEQYDENAVVGFNKTNTGLAISQLKDGEGKALWSMGASDNGLAAQWKDRPLLGYPTMLSALYPNVGANAFPLVFGDYSGYYQVNRVGFSIQVLDQVYAESNQIVLLGRVRLGGQVAEPWKLKVQKVST